MSSNLSLNKRASIPISDITLTATPALLYNFISASVCIAGTVIGFFFADKVGGFSGILLPVAAGGFIYISASDLVPELHKQKSERRAFISLAAFILGIGLMLLAKIVMGEHSH